MKTKHHNSHLSIQYAFVPMFCTNIILQTNHIWARLQLPFTHVKPSLIFWGLSRKLARDPNISSICIYMYTYMYVYISIRHTYGICIYVYIYIHILCIYMYTYMYIYIRHTYGICIYVYMWYLYVYMYIWNTCVWYVHMSNTMWCTALD